MVPRAPEHTGPERRQRRRREDDTTEHEILEAVVENAPKVSRLEAVADRVGKFGSALLILGAVIGGIVGGGGTALGMRLSRETDKVVPISARVDSNQVQILRNRIRIDSVELRASRRLDSVLTALTNTSRDIATIKNVLCVQLERDKSDLQRFGGCGGTH